VAARWQAWCTHLDAGVSGKFWAARVQADKRTRRLAQSLHSHTFFFSTALRWLSLAVQGTDIADYRFRQWPELQHLNLEAFRQVDLELLPNEVYAALDAGQSSAPPEQNVDIEVLSVARLTQLTFLCIEDCVAHDAEAYAVGRVVAALSHLHTLDVSRLESGDGVDYAAFLAAGWTRTPALQTLSAFLPENESLFFVLQQHRMRQLQSLNLTLQIAAEDGEPIHDNDNEWEGLVNDVVTLTQLTSLSWVFQSCSDQVHQVKSVQRLLAGGAHLQMLRELRISGAYVDLGCWVRLPGK
jgi:hypothetical protein